MLNSTKYVYFYFPTTWRHINVGGNNNATIPHALAMTSLRQFRCEVNTLILTCLKTLNTFFHRRADPHGI